MDRFPRLLSVLLCFCLATQASAGPPFNTDDPEPVNLHHWEFYLASHFERDPGGSVGTLPHLEVNYGVARNVQLHMIMPLTFNAPESGSFEYGLGDTEIGAKFRLKQEGRLRPMVGLFPLVDMPTGTNDRGLGAGDWQIFLPVWLQKSWSGWTSCGGSGVFLKAGMGQRHYWVWGWSILRDLSEKMILGGEITGSTPALEGAGSETDFNFGGQFNFSSRHHFLFSVGRRLSGKIEFMSYLGYQLAIGPGENEKSLVQPLLPAFQRQPQAGL
jgi:hypothetical protein